MSSCDLENGWVGTEDRDSEGEVLCRCEWCGEKIYEGEEYYDFDGDKVCESCVSACRKFA